MVVRPVVRRVLPILLGVAFLLAGIAFAAEREKSPKPEAQRKINHKKAFALYKQKCLQCHDSVADPEKPGRTMDDWLLVLKVMHGYGLDISPKETELIGGFLYDIRKGMEKEAG